MTKLRKCGMWNAEVRNLFAHNVEVRWSLTTTPRLRSAWQARLESGVGSGEFGWSASIQLAGAAACCRLIFCLPAAGRCCHQEPRTKHKELPGLNGWLSPSWARLGGLALLILILPLILILLLLLILILLLILLLPTDN